MSMIRPAVTLPVRPTGLRGTPVVPPPRDAVLPGIPTALDADAMVSIVGAHLEDCREGELRIVACHPVYIRYKPGTSCLVHYVMTFLGRDGATLATQGYLRLGDPQRTRQVWRDGSLQRLAGRASRRHPGPPRQRATLIPQLDAVLQLLPVDRELPSLVTLTSRSKMRRALGRSLTGPGRGLRLADPELVRYRPGRKALVRLRSRTSEGPVFYAKSYRDDRAARLFLLAGRLHEHGLPVASPTAFLAEVPAFVQAQATGRRLADLHADDDFVPAAALAGNALAQLHHADVNIDQVPGPIPGAGLVLEAARTLACLRPELAARLGRLSSVLAERIGSVETSGILIHGDFYDDQVLTDRGGVTLLDFDEARLGDPLVDIGNFLAHVSDRCPPATANAAREAFLVGYGAQRPDLRRGVALFEAAAVLRMAVGPFRRLQPDWPRASERLVDLAERRLAEASAVPRSPVGAPTPAARPRPAASSPHDPALPQLAEVCDRTAMGRHLSERLGVPVSVQDVAVVRHKQGRRCTVRYEVLIGGDGPRGLFGKTHASGRAARAHDLLLAFASAPVADGLRLPTAVAYIEPLGLSLQSAVDGAPVAPGLLSGDSTLARRMARALHAFHESGTHLEQAHGLEDELRPLEARIAQLAIAEPSLSLRAGDCWRWLLAGTDRVTAWRERPVHRDLYHDNILVSDHGLAFVDLDDAAMSEPTLDVANLTAHLRLLAAQRPAARQSLDAVRREFLGAYRSLDPELDPTLLAFLEVATLLRLAHIHQPRPHGSEVAGALIGEAERLMAGYAGALA